MPSTFTDICWNMINANGLATKWLMDKSVEAQLMMKVHWLSVLVCSNNLKIYADSNYSHCLDIQYTCSISLWQSLYVPLYVQPGTKIWILGHRPQWKSNFLCMSRWLISENVAIEVNKTDRYTEPTTSKCCQIVRMVKVYPKCVLKAVNVDWVMEYTSLFLDFFHQLFFPCSYQWHQRHRSPSLHLCLFLWEAFLLLLLLYFLCKSCNNNMWTRAMYIQACTKV